VPLIYAAEMFSPPDSHPIAMAGMLTLFVFTGLTTIVLISGADFSFLRSALWVGGWVALGVILCGMIFQFNLGLVFMGAMILLASGYILFDTSNVLHHYRIGQHVAASLALFASVALLFWYILQFVMSLSSRD
jgi:FtsH-binding integral membrane protein